MANISPGLAMTLYPMMAEPPSLAGASQATTAEPSPGIAVTPVGTPGGVVVVASSRGEARRQQAEERSRQTATWQR